MQSRVHYILALEPRHKYSEHCLQRVIQLKITEVKPPRISFPVLQSKQMRGMKQIKRFTHSDRKAPTLNGEHTTEAAEQWL
jgi:hypothetical protein